MTINIRVRVLEAAKETPYKIVNEKTGEVENEGVSIKQAVRYMWGENSAVGVIRLPNMREQYEPGDYEIHPDSFELNNGTLRTAKFLKLVRVDAARKAA